MRERIECPLEVIERRKDSVVLSEEEAYPLGKAIAFFNRNRALIEQASPDELPDVQHMIEHRIARDPNIFYPLVDTCIDVFLLENFECKRVR